MLASQPPQPIDHAGQVFASEDRGSGTVRRSELGGDERVGKNDRVGPPDPPPLPPVVRVDVGAEQGLGSSDLFDGIYSRLAAVPLLPPASVLEPDRSPLDLERDDPATRQPDEDVDLAVLAVECDADA